MRRLESGTCVLLCVCVWAVLLRQNRQGCNVDVERLGYCYCMYLYIVFGGQGLKIAAF